MRPLLPAERMVDVFDRASTLNFSIVAMVRGPLSRSRLVAALRALEVRHPLLRARVHRESMRFEPGAAEIPLREASDLHEVIAASLDHREWSDDGPRAELTWFPHEQTLMLTLHHLVSDGSSGIYAMRDLLRALASQPSERVPSPGINALLPPGHGGWRDKLQTARMLAGEMLRKPYRLGDYAQPAEARRACLFRAKLDAETSTRLRARARRDGATVHGVLCAALALGVAAEAGRTHVQRIVHPVCMRRYARERSVGEAVGYYVSSLDTDHRLADGASLPMLAKEISGAVQRKKARGEPLLTAPIAGPMFARQGARMQSARFRELSELRVLRNTFSLTNLGPLESLQVETQYGPYELEDLYFVAAGSVLATLGAAASTFRGELSLQIGSVTPIVPEAIARKLSERTFASLADYVRSA